MKILVTGAAGFIGSNLSRYLLNQCGHQVIAYDKLTYAGNRLSLSDLEDNTGFQFVQGDICDSELFAATLQQHQPDAIMHLAAESHVDRSIDGPRQFIETNIGGTFNLLQASLEYWRGLPPQRQTQFRFQHISTDEVYGSLGPGDPAFSETTPYDPHSPYSASKASSDHLVRAWQDTYGLPTLITNCSNNYGPYQFPEKLIPVVILKCLRGEPIPVYGKGENIRDWLYVDDHCRALEAVLTRGQVGQTYNIGGNNELKNIDLVHLLCNLMDELSPNAPRTGNQAPAQPNQEPAQPNQEPSTKNQEPRTSNLITFVKDRPGHDLRYAIDAGKMKCELDWTPLESTETGFRKTVQWYLDNQSWWQTILSGEYRLDRLGLNTASANP